MSAFNPAAFSGDIPVKYDRGLGPVLFVPFADDLVARIHAMHGDRILELAAGTGILTERLARKVGDGVPITATDLNDAMLEVLRKRTGGLTATAETADACDLHFEDESFDTVACQFGVMFFPDKVKSFVEARRVLRPGGKYFFNVWDDKSNNDFARCASEMLNEMFAGNPPKFYETPFGYADTAIVTADLREAGFTEVTFERVTKECTGDSVEAFCEGLIEGNPIVMELQALGGDAVKRARAEIERRIKHEFGDGPFRAKMQAIVFEATKS